MKILLLAPHPFFSDRGTPIAVRALCEVLGGRGDRITLLTYAQGEDIELLNTEIRRIPRIAGVDRVRPGFSFKKLICDAQMFARCRRLMREERFDLVHAVEESVFIALALGRRHHLPVVYDMDSSLAQQMIERFPWLALMRRFFESSERRAIRGSSAVLAVCQSLVDTALEHDPTQLVGRLEDVSLLEGSGEADERLAETIGSDGPIVMYVGNLEPYQGVDLLVEAFRVACAALPDAQLVVIGGAEADIRRYRAQCHESGIGDRAHFLGPRPLDELGHHLRQATVLVSPRTKGLNTAMKVYSYLDSGCAVLATRLPTHTQVLDDSIACLVSPEPEAMGLGLAKLLGDRALRERLAENAGQRVREEFSREAYRRKLLGFYEAVERKLGMTGEAAGPPGVHVGR